GTSSYEGGGSSHVIFQPARAELSGTQSRASGLKPARGRAEKGIATGRFLFACNRRSYTDRPLSTRVLSVKSVLTLAWRQRHTPRGQVSYLDHAQTSTQFSNETPETRLEYWPLIRV